MERPFFRSLEKLIPTQETLGTLGNLGTFNLPVASVGSVFKHENAKIRVFGPKNTICPKITGKNWGISGEIGGKRGDFGGKRGEIGGFSGGKKERSKRIYPQGSGEPYGSPLEMARPGAFWNPLSGERTRKNEEIQRRMKKKNSCPINHLTI